MKLFSTLFDRYYFIWQYYGIYKVTKKLKIDPGVVKKKKIYDKYFF